MTKSISVAKARLIVKQLTKEKRNVLNQIQHLIEEPENISLTTFSINKGVTNLFDKKQDVQNLQEKAERIHQAILELRLAVSESNHKSGADALLAEIASLHQDVNIHMELTTPSSSRTAKIIGTESYKDLNDLKESLLDRKETLRETDPNKVSVSLLNSRSFMQNIVESAQNIKKRISMKESELAHLNSATEINLTDFASEESLAIISELL